MVRVAVSVLFVLSAMAGAAVPEAAAAEVGVTISIEKHALPTASGGLVFQVHVVCGPLPGIPEFTEAFAGAVQAKTGAETEGGIDGTVVCDGVERVHSASLFFSITDNPFKRGPAVASAAVIACNIVGDNQVCIDGAAHERVVIAGREA